MKPKFFVGVVVVLLSALSVAGCQGGNAISPTAVPTAVPTLTPTIVPTPFSELNLEDLLVQPGDLPPGIQGSQIRSHPPAMFDGIVQPDYEVYQLFEQSGQQAGGVAVFVYEDMNDVREAYEFILKGMGGKQGTEPASLGDEAATIVVELPFSEERMTDLVWRHCHSVVHVRIGGTPDAAIAYGERLIERLSELVCR